MKRIFISAGDPSADKHSAELMNELTLLIPDVEFYGIGGPLAESQGLKSLASQKDIAVVGFWEVAKKYSFFKKLLENSKEIIRNNNIDLFIPIDYPGFNIPLAQYAQSIKIPVIYYIAPQLWAWGKGRAKKLAKCTDELLLVFPFEEKYFSDFGINAKFVGHPLLDYPEFSSDFNKLEQRENLIAVLPGSRKQEIINHKNFLNEIYDEFKSKLPNYQLAIAKSSNISDEFYKNINPNYKIFNNSNELMKIAKAGIIKTGTSNLEAMLSGLPFAMFYKTSMITYVMAKKLVNLPYISIVNILSNQFAVPEFIQNEAKPAHISSYINSILQDESKYTEIQRNFTKLRSELGNSGAAKRAAKIIASKL